MRSTQNCSLTVLLLLAGAMAVGSLSWCATAQEARPAVQVRPATAATSNMIANSAERQRTRLGNLPIMAGTFTTADLPRFQIIDGQLHVTTNPALNPGRWVRLELADSHAQWALYNAPSGASVTLERHEHDLVGEAGFWMVSITARSTTVTVNGEGGLLNEAYRVRCDQRPGNVRFFVQEMNNGRPGRRVVDITVRDFSELRARHPAEVRTHLVPLLQLLGQEDAFLPGAGDVYRVFPDLQPSEEHRHELAEIVTRLGDASPVERELARNDLVSMGRPAVLAAMHMPMDDLLPEQSIRLREWIASQTFRPRSPEALRIDPWFLADCLEDPDPQVVAAAVEALERLGGDRLEIDPAAPLAERAAAADALRQRLSEPAGE